MITGNENLIPESSEFGRGKSGYTFELREVAAVRRRKGETRLDQRPEASRPKREMLVLSPNAYITPRPNCQYVLINRCYYSSLLYIP
jgi:hypothetical protein